MVRALLLAGLCLPFTATAEQAVEHRRYLLGSSPLELAVFPAQAQVSFQTRQIGLGLGLGWHLNDLFSVQLSGLYNYVSAHNDYYSEVPTRVASTEPSPLTAWSALAGIELAPLKGESNVGRLSLVLNAGLGAGATRHQLARMGGRRPAIYADTGVRFLAALGAGFRMEVNHRFAVRLEIQDVLFYDQVQTVNGCNAGDLRLVDDALRNGAFPPTVSIGSGCRVDSFRSIDPFTGREDWDQVPMAANLVKPPYRSGLAQNVTVKLGATFQF